MKNILKFFRYIFWALTIIVLASVIIFTIIGRQKSGKAHCIIVKNENDFIGNHLKYTVAEDDSYLMTKDCEEKDKTIDAGDGNKKGKVRWVECFKGPDCEELGKN